jgi:integrase/recombinase XerD
MNDNSLTKEIPELIKGLRAYLESVGYKDFTLTYFNSVWNGLLDYAKDQEKKYFSMELGRKFLKEKYGIMVGSRLTHEKRCKIRPIQLISDYQLHGIISLYKKKKNYSWPDQFSQMFEDFVKNYGTRKLSPKTINQVRINVEKFATYLNNTGIKEFSEVSAADLEGYIQTLSKYEKGSIAYALRVLKRLCEYAYKKGVHPIDLTFAIPVIHYDKRSRIPSTFTANEVKLILDTIDRGSPVGKRNYAIILLAAKLGIRSGDIRNLKLENLKWDTQRIELIQEKTGQLLNLPILGDVGFALIDYLKYGRPQTDLKYVFLRHNAPHVKMSATGLYDIIIRCIRLAKIHIPPGKKHGLHALRHSLASTLLEEKTPLVVISEILGHIDSNTTGAYLKIDITRLRMCSLEVPYEIN